MPQPDDRSRQKPPVMFSAQAPPSSPDIEPVELADATTSRPSGTAFSRSMTALRIGVAVLYLALGAVTIGGLALFALAMSQAQSAPQEAAIAAMFAAWFIATYIIVRCCEKAVTLPTGK